MALPAKRIIFAVSLLAPACFAVGTQLLAGESGAFDVASAILSWLYMAAPQLVALTVAAFYAPARERFLPIALVSSVAALVAFRVWIFLFVPGRESGIAWVLYIPTWMVLLLAITGWLQWRSKQGSTA